MIKRAGLPLSPPSLLSIEGQPVSEQNKSYNQELNGPLSFLSLRPPFSPLPPAIIINISIRQVTAKPE
jgi:hypothetical protein